MPLGSAEATSESPLCTSTHRESGVASGLLPAIAREVANGVHGIHGHVLRERDRQCTHPLNQCTGCRRVWGIHTMVSSPEISREGISVSSWRRHSRLWDAHYIVPFSIPHPRLYPAAVLCCFRGRASFRNNLLSPRDRDMCSDRENALTTSFWLGFLSSRPRPTLIPIRSKNFTSTSHEGARTSTAKVSNMKLLSPKNMSPTTVVRTFAPLAGCGS